MFEISLFHPFMMTSIRNPSSLRCHDNFMYEVEAIFNPLISNTQLCHAGSCWEIVSNIIVVPQYRKYLACSPKTSR